MPTYHCDATVQPHWVASGSLSPPTGTGTTTSTAPASLAAVSLEASRASGDICWTSRTGPPGSYTGGALASRPAHRSAVMGLGSEGAPGRGSWTGLTHHCSTAASWRRVSIVTFGVSAAAVTTRTEQAGAGRVAQ